jgi:hypothetical protein
MAMTTYTGTLKELGPSVEEASERIGSKQYAYIEFTDGEILRNICVVGGLDGKLDAALDDQGQIALYIMHGGKKADLLVAVRTSDGKVFATDLGGGSLLGYGMVAGTVVLGLGLIPLFGIGLVFLWVAWRSWHGIRLVEAAKTYVRDLPNVIFV